MPTIKSPTKQARERNIREMIGSGMKPERAVAAGYRIQRQPRGSRGRKGRGK